MSSFRELLNNKQAQEDWNTPDRQWKLMEFIGDASRNYVMDKYPDAQPVYMSSKGKRTHVGIFATGGVEIDEKQNYCKQQHRAQLLGTLIPYSGTTDSYVVRHNTECWTVCAMQLRKQYDESVEENVCLFILEWLEGLKQKHFPHFTLPQT